MANTQAGTLITRCLDYISRASTGTTRSGQTLENMAMSWLNAAQMRISKVHDFREMYKIYTRDTIADTKSYAFPTNWKVVLSLRVEDGTASRKLGMVRPEQLDKYRPYPEDDPTSTPQIYVPYGNDFELVPIPDAAYTLYMRTVMWPTVITSTATAIDYEPNKDDVILAYMMADAYNYLQMLTDASKWEGVAKQRFAEAYKIDTNRPDWNPVAEGFQSIDGEHFAEDRYDTTTGEWIVNPFLMRKV
jgi:hypothetical protein